MKRRGDRPASKKYKDKKEKERAKESKKEKESTEKKRNMPQKKRETKTCGGVKFSETKRASTRGQMPLQPSGEAASSS
jgi:outer membrane biosynthesis protein TonB